MFTFHFKIKKRNNIKFITYFISWFLLIALIITTSYIFLFIYKNIYSAIVQEIAIINLKTELSITKVQKNNFDTVATTYIKKLHPLTNIDFERTKNPFKSINLPTKE